ncbi:hypothetical protein KIPB_008233, partial [Kipferlia bialata]
STCIQSSTVDGCSCSKGCKFDYASETCKGSCTSGFKCNQTGSHSCGCQFD